MFTDIDISTNDLKALALRILVSYAENFFKQL